MILLVYVVVKLKYCVIRKNNMILICLYHYLQVYLIVILLRRVKSKMLNCLICVLIKLIIINVKNIVEFMLF